MVCKTIILSNTNNIYNNAPKGILTLSKEAGKTKGKIRLYNIVSLPSSVKIGIYVNNDVHMSILTKKSNYYEFDLDSNIDITQNLYCALIDIADNKQVLLEGGSYNGFCFTDSPIDAVLEAKDEELEQTIDEALNKPDSCSVCDCENCEYKKYFYQNHKQETKSSNIDIKQGLNVCNTSDDSSDCDQIDNVQQQVISDLEQELIDDINNMSCLKNSTNNDLPNNVDDSKSDEKLNFLNEIIYQLDELLAKYPEDELLNSIIPNSRFVKVDGDNPYVVGVIYENKLLKYIAYGVPASYNTLPPADLGQHYQWLPLNPRDVMSDGYFMIYQDAINGTIVEINFE